MDLLKPIQSVGQKTIHVIREMGKMAIFLATSVGHALTPPYLPFRAVKQTYFIGIKTIPVILLTGAFTGMVLTLQGYYVLIRFGAESTLGTITALSLIRELGPVITALMVIGRAGSALTAEIGIMRMSEQIDALDVMNLNPYKYLIVPNFWGAVISLPILSAMFIVIGVWGGYMIGVMLTGLSSGTYFGAIQDTVQAQDLLLSLYKALTFGVIIALVSCYKGFYADSDGQFGAQGVSKATTDAVVLSSVLVLISDYYITSVMILK